jgi:hypothetical protein
MKISDQKIEDEKWSIQADIKFYEYKKLCIDEILKDGKDNPNGIYLSFSSADNEYRCNIASFENIEFVLNMARRTRVLLIDKLYDLKKKLAELKLK